MSEELQGLSHRELARVLGMYVTNVRDCTARFGGLGPSRSGVLRPVYEARWGDTPEVDQICPNPLTGGRIRRTIRPDRIKVAALEGRSETSQFYVELRNEPSRFANVAIPEGGNPDVDPASIRDPMGPARLFPGAWTLRAVLESHVVIENNYFCVRVSATF